MTWWGKYIVEYFTKLINLKLLKFEDASQRWKEASYLFPSEERQWNVYKDDDYNAYDD